MLKGLSFKSHPSEDLLEEYAFQRLAEEQVAPLEEHLLVCSSCQKALAEIDEYLLLMQRGTAQIAVSPAREPQLSWWRGWMPKRAPATKWAHNWAWTAAGALACLVAAILLSHRPFESVPIAPVTIALASLRGSGETITAPHGAPLDLQLDPGDSSSPAAYRIEIVTAAGKQVWNGEAKLIKGKLETEVTPGLGKGLYWVRLYESEKLRSETGLLVQ